MEIQKCLPDFIAQGVVVPGFGQEAVNGVVPGFYPTDALKDYEAVVELSYKAQMTAWWTMQVDVQRAIHPGGSAAIPDAWVFILASTLRF